MTVDRLRIYEDALRLICTPMAERTGFNCFNDYHIAWQALKDAAALDAASPLTGPAFDRVLAYRLLRFRHRAATIYEMPTDVVERELPEALEFIAATAFTDEAVATTPTPDQGALERAHEIALRIYPNRNSAHHQYLASIILDGLTVTASEARAAAIEECARWHNAYAVSKMPWSGTHNYAAEIHRESAASIRALATPAQSPSPQTKEPE